MVLKTCLYIYGPIINNHLFYITIDSILLRYFSITICHLNCRMNSLLAAFSYCNSDTISMLFKSYCVNIYGSQIWEFHNKEVNILYTAWRKAIC